MPPETLLSLPGKCFLFGEYAALENGPAILLTMPPYFELAVRPGRGKLPFHQASPAGLFWQAHADFFSQWHVEFHDPFHGQGGFGRSTAEFGLLYLLYAQEQNQNTHRNKIAWDARVAYQELLKHETRVPSGLDLIAQIADRPKETFLYIDPQKNLLRDLSSLPPGLGLFLVQSGRKAPTHEHLQKLGAQKINCVPELNQITREAYTALSSHIANPIEDRNRGSHLGELLNQYAQTLRNAGLASESSQNDLDAIRRIPGIVGAKGCGALGTDVYAVIIYKSDRRRFLRELKNLSLGKIFDFHAGSWIQA